MVSDLIATKLLIPPPIRHAVPRTHLRTALESGVPGARIVLVTAPAGYGKTTLVAEWSRESNLPVGWLTISRSENDPRRFLQCLLRAWASVDPEVLESSFGLLLGSAEPSIEAALAAFLNVAREVPSHLVFVLDDYQLIAEPEVHAALATLVEQLPPTVHFVIVSRTDPSLPLARYRARHELLEVHAEELRFDLDETTAFLHDGMNLNLQPGEVMALHRQLEGWITGLQLVALTHRHRREPADRIVVSGRHRHVADYLSEEVIVNLPEETRQFLLASSVLERLNGVLCDYVLQVSDSQDVLEGLERANLFLVPLDDHRTWFRYHRIFAEFLRETLRRHHPETVRGLQQRAAEWFLQHDLPELAFQHALEGQHGDLVALILEQYVALKMFSGETRLVKYWLDSIPADWFDDYPEMILAQSAYLLLTGQPEGCAQRLGELERRLGAEQSKASHTLARATAVRCFIACFGNDLVRAEAYAQQALQDLPAEDLAFRANLYHALGETYRGNGRWDDARANYLKVLTFAPASARSPLIRLISVHVYGALADLELRQGHLRNATDYWDRALTAFEDPDQWGHFDLPVTGWVYVRKAELLYEWNELAQAREYITRGIERAELGGDPHVLIAGMVILARLELTDGNTAAAEADLDRARNLLEDAPFPDWAGRYDRCRVELWLARNKLGTAMAWAETNLSGDPSGIRSTSAEASPAIARVLVLKGDPAALIQAEALLATILASAEELGQSGIVIESCALRAMVHARRGDQASMLADIERALRLSEPEGYIRLFADLGQPMTRTLHEARNRGVMRAYVDQILSACVGTGSAGVTGNLALVEPLSERELEVLRLIATGLTNREISAALYVSPETIKKHTGNIYGKLGVHGRVEAVSRARELAVLD